MADRQAKPQFFLRPALRSVLSLAVLATLSACAGHQYAQLSPVEKAHEYQAKAKARYTPPGSPEDPWGPYVIEASQRFDVPVAWIRGVMRVESGGYEFRADGSLTTSPVGAMGLMQVMPDTYTELRARYGFTDDPYDPHNNILAGTAYLREMYDAFGNPGFLAAYNAGPARLEDYLTHNRPLPDETRRYVAMIGPYVRGEAPISRSPAEQYAVNQIPIDIPAGPRYAVHHNVALAARERRDRNERMRYAANSRRHYPSLASQQPIEVAEAPEPRARAMPTSPFQPQLLAAAAPTHRHGSLHLIEQAQASESLVHGGSWAVQVGAFANPGQARAAAGAAHGVIGHASAVVATFRDSRGVFYRARLSGLTHEGAVQACQKLARSRSACILVSPAAQS